MFGPGYAEMQHKLNWHNCTFQSLVEQADTYVHKRRYIAAAVYAEIAANYAMCKHTGRFVSPQLEQILLDIGRQAIPSASAPRRYLSSTDAPRQVLHVLTRAFGIGGDARMVWRWIQQDSTRSHSVALTRQGALQVPQPLQDVVNKVQGNIYVLNEHRGTILSWARMLRELSISVDLVVLHVHPYDIIPVLAFADKQHTPPVIYANHADHVFWIGASVSDVVANLRESGSVLSRDRRGITAERCGLLPIILNPIERTLTRSQAKAQLGVPQDAVMLLSIARSHKYMPFNGQNYVDTLLPVLEKYPQAVLLVIGPDHTGAWVSASDRTQGRVRAFEQRDDTAMFYEAADIYLDAFPITSITSLLEAGSYGTPLVSRCPHAEDLSVLNSDTPALRRNMRYTDNLEDYQRALSQLIEDADLREQLGMQIRQDIIDVHHGDNWQKWLEAIYQQANTLPPLHGMPDHIDRHYISEVDILLPYLFREEPDLDKICNFHLRLMPLDLRVRMWSDMLRSEKKIRLPGLLLPEWLGVSMEKRRFSRQYQ